MDTDIDVDMDIDLGQLRGLVDTAIVYVICITIYDEYANTGI